MNYPILVGDVRIESRGYLLQWLRANYYSQFRRMHISGWRGCATWEQMVCKLGDIEGFSVREAQNMTTAIPHGLPGGKVALGEITNRCSCGAFILEDGACQLGPKCPSLKKTTYWSWYCPCATWAVSHGPDVEKCPECGAVRPPLPVLAHADDPAGLSVGWGSD